MLIWIYYNDCWFFFLYFDIFSFSWHGKKGIYMKNKIKCKVENKLMSTEFFSPSYTFCLMFLFTFCSWLCYVSQLYVSFVIIYTLFKKHFDIFYLYL